MVTGPFPAMTGEAGETRTVPSSAYCRDMVETSLAFQAASFAAARFSSALRSASARGAAWAAEANAKINAGRQFRACFMTSFPEGLQRPIAPRKALRFLGRHDGGKRGFVNDGEIS